MTIDIDDTQTAIVVITGRKPLAKPTCAESAKKLLDSAISGVCSSLSILSGSLPEEINITDISTTHFLEPNSRRNGLVSLRINYLPA